MSESSPSGLSTPDAGARHAGELLRQAREAQGLTLEALAATIKVPLAKLEILESGQFDRLPDANFARSLAMTVCRVLRIDPTEVMARMPAAKLRPLMEGKEPLNQPFRDGGGVPALFDHKGRIEWSGLFKLKWLAPAGLLLAAALVYLLPESIEMPSWPKLGSESASAPASEADNVASVPQPVVIPPASAVLPASAVASAPLAASSASVPVVAASAAVTAAETPSAASPAVPPPAVQVSGVAGATLQAREAAWVEARDAQGAKLLSRLVQAGESVNLEGPTPLLLRIGNAKGVQLSFKGQPVDLVPLTRNNVARVELK